MSAIARATKSGRVVIEVPVALGTVDGKKISVRNVEAKWSEGGLAVTRSINRPDLWEITHCSSGYTLPGPYRTQKTAIAVARRFLALGDWTRSRTATKRDRALHEAAKTLWGELVEEGVR